MRLGRASVLYPSRSIASDFRSSSAAICATAMLIAGAIAQALMTLELDGAPQVGAALLMGTFAFISLIAGDFRAPLLGFVLAPAFFGLSAWDSPVRTFVGTEKFPIFIFDFLLAAFGFFALFVSFRRRNGPVRVFLRKHGLLLAVFIAGLLLKVASAGLTPDVLRNTAMFYYFPIVAAAVLLCWETIEIRTFIPDYYVRALHWLVVVPLIIMFFMVIGLQDMVLDQVQQGILRRAGVLYWIPPGSLLLFCFLGAMILPDRRVSLGYKVCLVVLLLYDFVTYWNRAMWFAITGGLVVHWVMGPRWLLKTAAIAAALAVVLTFGSAVQEQISQGHHESSEWRLLAWAITAASIVDEPLWGHPFDAPLLDQVLALPDSVAAMHDAEINISAEARSPHNSYLSLLFFGGLTIGGAALIFIFTILTRLAMQVHRSRCKSRPDLNREGILRGAVAITVYTAFNVVLESPVEGIAFWVLMMVAWAWSVTAVMPDYEKN